MHDDSIERRRPWTLEDVSALRSLVEERIDPSLIAMKLKRAEEDVRAKASEIGRLIRSSEAQQRH